MQHRLQIAPAKQGILRCGECIHDPRRHQRATDEKAVGDVVVLRDGDDSAVPFTALLKLMVSLVIMLPIRRQHDPPSCGCVANLRIVGIVGRSLRLRGDDDVPSY